VWIRSENVARIIGVGATVVAAIAVATVAFAFIGLAFKLALVALVLYATFGVVQFWVSQAWRDGLTVNEIGLAAFWPKDVYNKIKEGEKLRSAASTSVRSTVQNDDSATVLNATVAVIVGIVVSALVLGADWLVLQAVVGIVWQVLILVAVAWAVGFVVHFWASRAWKDGLTRNEVLLAVAWPVDILRIGYQAAKAVF
jgi:hypothetical protein